jgi:hypothetical protein
MDFSQVSRSAVGGWRPDDWEEAVRAHSRPPFEKLNVPRPMSPSVAISMMKSVFEEELKALLVFEMRRSGKEYSCQQSPLKVVELSLSHLYEGRRAFWMWKQIYFRRSHGWAAAEKLIFSSIEDVVYDPDNNEWSPSPGCMSRPALWPRDLGESHLVNAVPGKFLLPFIGASKEEPEYITEMNRMLDSYVNTGMMRVWNFDWGFPTVVSSVFVIARENNGKTKFRLIIDYRYANGIVQQIELLLPTFKEAVAGTQRGDVFAKQDMKGGYHQMSLDPSYYHMACIAHRGKIWFFTVTSFGWRDVPGRFQAHTSHVSEMMKARIQNFVCRKCTWTTFSSASKLILVKRPKRTPTSTF